jgi:diaminopimelate decarboxylase
MPAVVQHLSSLIDGFDVASSGEMQVALDTPISTKNIGFAGPGKTDNELRQAVAADVTINMESEGEMRRIAKIAEESGIQPRVAIRVNPDFELKSSGMSMGGGAKQFGVDAERVPAMLKELKSLGLLFVGFQIFWGSQNLNAEAISDAHEKTIGLAIRLSEQTSTAIQHLYIGGGLGIPYFPGDKRLDIRPIGDHLDKLLIDLRVHFPNVDVITELGRFIVGEAGLFVCEVTDVKESRGEKFIITNGGMHHHLAASGNFGQIIRKNYPVTVGSVGRDAKSEVVTITGPLCTPLDILAKNIALPATKPGDLVVIFQSGAYGYTASPDRFLGHPSISEILV